MKLFKNVDILDIEGILEKGILSIDELGDDNWEDGRRGTNATDVVYLYEKIGDIVPVQYGLIALEVDVEDVVKKEMLNTDVNVGRYNEYVCAKVDVCSIKKIICPTLFRAHIEDKIPAEFTHLVEWRTLTATHYDGTPCTDDDYAMISDSCAVTTYGINYLRAVNEKRHVIDFYNYKYI